MPSHKPAIGRESAERRIVARYSVPIDVAREMWAGLGDELREERDYGDRRHEVTAAHLRDKALDN
jgi:hypothetical protein